MALKKCKECGREISSSVKKCPHCGKRQKKPIWKRWWFWIILVLFIFIVLIGSGGETSKPSEEYKTASIEEIKQEAIENLSYEELFRNNSQYIGKVVHYLGEVTQVTETSGDSYILRANVTKGEYGFWENDVYLNYEGERVLEDDLIEFWGEVKGVKKYTTVLGASRSVPEITILHLKILEGSTNSTEPIEAIAPTKSEEKKQENPIPQTKTYQQVFTFSGDGSKKSEPFTITGDRFKVKYDCSGDLCQAFLKKPTSEWDIELIMNSTGSVKDETVFYGAGEYYIDSNSLGNYSMVVEDYR